MSLEVLPSTHDVIAVRIDGKLDHASLQRVMDMVEQSLSDRDETHMFIEAIGFGGFEAAHLGEYVRRALPLLGKLKRFGRIAVVSDQAWVRAAARIESALLPNIGYEVYDIGEREQALAWVEGRESRAHGAGIRVMETSRPDVLAFEIDGKLARRDLEAVAERFTAAMAGHETTRVLGRIVRLGGAELRGLLDDDLIRMKLAALGSVERYAIVGGPPWLAGWVSVIDRLAKADIRHFELGEEAAAWKWIEAESRTRPSIMASGK